MQKNIMHGKLKNIVTYIINLVNGDFSSFYIGKINFFSKLPSLFLQKSYSGGIL